MDARGIRRQLMRLLGRGPGPAERLPRRDPAVVAPLAIGIGDSRMGGGIAGIPRDHGFELLDGESRPAEVLEVAPLQIQVVGLDILGGGRHEGPSARPDESGLEPLSDRARDLVLNRKDVLHLAVVTLGPEVVTARDVDQLGRDPEPPPGLTNASFEHRAHPELGADPSHVRVLSLEGEGGRARGDTKRLDLRKRVDDFVGDSVAEVLGVALSTHVAKRQDGHRRRRGGCLQDRGGPARGFGKVLTNRRKLSRKVFR